MPLTETCSCSQLWGAWNIQCFVFSHLQSLIFAEDCNFEKENYVYCCFWIKSKFHSHSACNIAAAHSGGRLLSKQSCKSRGQLNWSGHQFAGSHSRKPHVSCCYDVDDTAGSWQTKLIVVNMFVHLLYYCCFCVSTCTWPNLRNEMTLKRPIW